MEDLVAMSKTILPLDSAGSNSGLVLLLTVLAAIGGEEQSHDPQCALEVSRPSQPRALPQLNVAKMAIATESKHFLSSPLVQTLVNDIYRGRVVFSMTSHHSVLADNYKPRAIDIYNVHNAPFLDHYRLRVPRYSAILEFLNFVMLLSLFLLALASKLASDSTSMQRVNACISRQGLESPDAVRGDLHSSKP